MALVGAVACRSPVRVADFPVGNDAGTAIPTIMNAMADAWSNADGSRSDAERYRSERGPCSIHGAKLSSSYVYPKQMPPRPLTRLRKLCLALPEAHEVEAWGEPTFRVRNKLFAMYADADNHHGAGRPSVWCKAGPGNQAAMVRADPDRFFVPPYVGPSGWIGIRLDRNPDWAEVGELIRDAYRLVAPKRLLATLP